MNQQAKENLIESGDQAFMVLANQIHHLLDLVDFYVLRWPISLSESSDGEAIRHEDLKLAVNTLGTLPYQVADQIRRWKHGEPRVLSRLGVELELLNEIWSTIEALTLFFIRADIDLHPFNRQKAQLAFDHLVRMNKILD